MNDTENSPIVVNADNYFAAIPYWVLELGMSSTAVHLYVILTRFANWTSHQGYPSRKRLADCMNVSIPTVDRAKDELVAAGVLKYDRRHNKSNYYTIITERLGSIKNSTSIKNDISRGIKNDTLTKVNNNNKTPEVKTSAHLLVQLYLDNLPKDQKIRPSGNQLGGQIKQLLKTYTHEVLAGLIPLVAQDGKPLSAGTLMIAQSNQPNTTPTRTPPKYDSTEYEQLLANAVPMPDSVKALKDALRYGAEIPKIGA